MAADTLLRAEEQVYTAAFCEENVWHLCQRLPNLRDCFVVFISNAAKQVPLWNQRAGRVDGLVCWDYHVLLLQRTPAGTLVWDLDSTLPFPCPFHRWSIEALGAGQFRLPPQFTRLFRVVPAAVFLRHFASDRSHMWDDEGRWHQPPPPYPCIVAPGGATHTLPRYLDMPPAEGALGDGVAAARALERCSSRGGDGEGGGRWGVVLTQEALLECFENGSGG